MAVASEKIIVQPTSATSTKAIRLAVNQWEDGASHHLFVLGTHVLMILIYFGGIVLSQAFLILYSYTLIPSNHDPPSLSMFD